MALQFVDPREEALPDSGLIALEDAELGTRRLVDSGSRRVRDAYARAALERRSAFRRWCASAGIVGHEVSTADDPIGPLIRIFSRRTARRHVP